MTKMIQSGEAFEQVRERALRLLTVRSRSVKELADRLASAGYLDEVIQAVLQRLEQTGLLDDRRFSLERARALGKGKGFGPQKVRADLLKRGVPEELVNEALTQAYEGLPPQEVMRKWVKKHFGDQSLLSSSDAKVRGKVQRFLLGRGFDPEQIQELFSAQDSL